MADDDEAALLAELRAISAKSAASRFDDDNVAAGPVGTSEAVEEMKTDSNGISLSKNNHQLSDNDAGPENKPETIESSAEGREVEKPKPSPKPKSRQDDNRLPPWKRKGPKAQAEKQPEIDVVIAAPPPAPMQDTTASEPPEPESKPAANPEPPAHGIKPDIPSTFHGDRGGPAEDAELLALLRGVSSKSASASRFTDDTEAKNVREAASEQKEVVEAVVAKPEPSPKPKSRRGDAELPPWKRKGPSKAQAEKQPEIDVVIAAPPPPAPVQDTTASEPPEPESKPAAKPEPPAHGIKPDIPSTFSGDRGGPAEDAELLALLRGVSSKSASASRFADDTETANDREAASESEKVVEVVIEKPKPSPKPKSRRDDDKLPPWKQKGPSKAQAEKQPEIAVVIAAPAPPAPVQDTTASGPPEPESKQAANPEPPTHGTKPDLPSTFRGDRGDPAEDAELLALLRGVSSKSAGTSRFADDTETANDREAASEPEEVVEVVIEKPKSSPKPKSRRDDDKVPPWKRPWKRKGSKTQAEKQPEIDVVIAAPTPPASSQDTSAREAQEPESKPVADSEPPTHGIKSELPSTFRGDRGGPAEDAELLALLRGVSANSTSANRFGDTVSVPDAKTVTKQYSTEAVGTEGLREAHVDASTQPYDEVTAPSSPVGVDSRMNGAESTEDELTRDDLPTALSDKNWRVRGQAYDLLCRILSEMVQGKDRAWDIDGNSIVEGLDNLVPSIVADTNASALDKALGFALLYAEHCRGAGDAEQAARIVSSLTKKNGFSSRPTTVKLSSSLALKLMEVGADGMASVHSVVEALLTEGLGSRKPKVVQACASLILETAYEFGAARLPLASIVSSAPRMLSHSNGKVRENGIRIVAEICRALGSRDHMQDVIDAMKKAQVAELDSLLKEQPEATPNRTKLRCEINDDSTPSALDAIAALEAGTKELEAQRFAARPAVNLIAALYKSDYASRIEMTKWSEKVAALNIVLECGGEKPYKLAPQSSSVNYLPLISDMKKLLPHTHFAVCGKAMEVLAMLAQGVGGKLFPYLRPLMTNLLQLSKDKKLTRPVGSCLDSFFGNVLGFDHLLEEEDAVPSAVDEHKQKNALARTSALELLERCVRRGESAGARGTLTARSARLIASLCVAKLGDSNASVRKAASDTLRALQEIDDPKVVDVMTETVEPLKSANPRAYKALSKDAPSREKAGKVEGRAVRIAAPVASASPSKAGLAADKRRTTSPAQATKEVKNAPPSAASTPFDLEEALAHISGQGIPQWDAPEDDGGVLSGLESSKWMFRQDAIKSITAFIESGQLGASSDIERFSSSVLVVVGEHTRGFKETNVNIMKAIIQLFLSLCDCHEEREKPITSWSMNAGAAVAAQKLSDRKLSNACKMLLTSLCVVSPPHSVLLAVFESLKSVKSPIAHEEYLKWIKSFCSDFGAASIGPRVSEIIPLLLEEMDSTNVKVKREALAALGTIHSHTGASFKALTLSLSKSDVKEALERCFDEHPFDSSLQSTEWPKRSLVEPVAVPSSASNKFTSNSSLALEIPKSDLSAELPDDCVSRLASKDGKTAWKVRKQALDEIDAALKRCSGLLNTSGPRLKDLVDLSRALRDRLSDTQINLKPVAARIIGALLSAVDRSTQAKLGKLVYAPLISLSMNDIKKPTRDAALDALRAGTTASPLDGGNINEEALEAFVTALVAEVNESSVRASGLPDVLQFLRDVAGYLPNLDNVVASRGQPLGEKYATALIECLTSSKSETRAAASEVLEISIERVIGMASIRKAMDRLKPATQRSIGPQIAKLSKNTPASKQAGKENDEPYSDAAASQRQVSTATNDMPRRPKATTSSEIPKRTSSKVESPRQGDRKHKAESHPLIARVGAQGIQKTIVWPEYPEEPQGSTIFGNLKKQWSPALPPLSATSLFPSSGIRKQDDGESGCEVLSRALAIDRRDGSESIEAQLDPILKWTAFVLCSKETTVGLQVLLNLIHNLLKFLVERKRELLDPEALVLVPFVLEKASISKGRFRERFMEIVSLIQSEQILPPRRLGPTVCVALIDRSTHAKARVLGCRLCLNCIEKDGLTGIGKKGVLATAKLLSEETLPENRAAALDLMELILSKMNGDMQRLMRICGPNLSDKARQLLEDRWHKRGKKNSGDSPETLGYQSKHKSPALSRSPRREVDSEWQSALHDQLPALSLREASKEPAQQAGIIDDSPVKSFAFSSTDAPDPVPKTDFSKGRSLESEQGAAGAAASLRARLLKIREKSKGPQTTETAQGVKTESPSASMPSVDDELLYTDGILRLKYLISLSPPLDEEDSDLFACIDALKKFHAALSKQQHSAVGLTVSQLSRLRELIAERLSETIQQLTTVIGFAFDCGHSSINAGMSIPLLSVCLATLMALFRDSDLATTVSQDDLTLLVRETGTALLDARLASSSEELDEATGSQMVRAINKLAVQAATGATRHTALQALMSLQQQLSLDTVNVQDDEEFNSRLARVVFKLFSRVIKAEESVPEPFSFDAFDMEAIICSMEDFLVASQQVHGESSETCSEMVRALVASILQSHDPSMIRKMMDDLDINSQSSSLGVIVSCEEETSASQEKAPIDVPVVSIDVEYPADSTIIQSPTVRDARKDVATLVSSLANAPQGPERDAALAALREYKAANGDEELVAHLQQVSSPFRSFIEEQMASAEATPEKPGIDPAGGSMSARLRNLRSRLQATEIVVQSAVEEKPVAPSPVSRIPSPSKIPSPVTRSSKLSQPSPTKLAPPSKSKIPSSSSQTLRERLAASQNRRAGNSDTVSDSVSASMGRAAALRARLEAVKQKSKQSSPDQL